MRGKVGGLSPPYFKSRGAIAPLAPLLPPPLAPPPLFELDNGDVVQQNQHNILSHIVVESKALRAFLKLVYLI